jgi:hypothetical protein
MYLIYFLYLLLLTCSVVGYGFVFSNLINKDLATKNLGYQGIFGLIFLLIVSYITIFFTKHNYTHNIILHIIGITLFFFNSNKKEFLIKILYFTIIFYLAFLVIKNHEDFPYYHLTNSLVLTENKLFIGLGNLDQGYRHSSSLFFLNSIFFLPIIKYFFFHYSNFIIFIFFNFIVVNNLLDKKKIISFNYLYLYYLSIFIYVNIKFFRIGGYGTDIAGQLIVFLLIGEVINILDSNLDKKNYKVSLQIIFIFISFIITFKAYFIVYFIFLLLIYYVSKKKIIFIKTLFYKRLFFLLLFLLFLNFFINFLYTGCFLYPIADSCFHYLPWALGPKEVSNMHIWYEGWAKAGAGPDFRTENLSEYIKGFNWIPQWFYKYFLISLGFNLLKIFSVPLFLFILFYRIKKRVIINNIINFYLIYLFIFLLFIEWFYNHPTLRYGGYALIAAIIFLPFCKILEKSSLNFKLKKKIIFLILVIIFLSNNFRNGFRIYSEIKKYNPSNFPFYWIVDVGYREWKLDYGVSVYVPNNNSMCWAIKTPCTAGAEGLVVKKFLNYNGFVDFNKK